jgi:hypothetical protein
MGSPVFLRSRFSADLAVPLIAHEDFNGNHGFMWNTIELRPFVMAADSPASLLICAAHFAHTGTFP